VCFHRCGFRRERGACSVSTKSMVRASLIGGPRSKKIRMGGAAPRYRPASMSTTVRTTRVSYPAEHEHCRIRAACQTRLPGLGSFRKTAATLRRGRLDVWGQGQCGLIGRAGVGRMCNSMIRRRQETGSGDRPDSGTSGSIKPAMAAVTASVSASVGLERLYEVAI
jgi:hypothetical protein